MGYKEYSFFPPPFFFVLGDFDLNTHLFDNKNVVEFDSASI